MFRQLILMILTCVCVGSLFAQSRPFDMRIVLARPFPLGSLKSNEYGDTNPGFGAGLLVGYAITSHVRIGAEVSVYQMNDPRQPEDWGVVLVPTLANLRIGLSEMGRIRLYGSLAGGILHEAVTLPGLVDPRYGSFAVPIMSVGGGFQYPLADHASVDIAVNYYHARSDGKNVEIEGDRTRISYATNYVNITVGLDFAL